jgi:hypothetical protein
MFSLNPQLKGTVSSKIARRLSNADVESPLENDNYRTDRLSCKLRERDCGRYVLLCAW